MHLICNELSFFPLAENGFVAEARFKQFFKTFSIVKEKYGFTHIRLPKDYENIEIIESQTFFVWVSTLTNQTIKNLVLGLCKPPYTDDLDSNELSTFFESSYSLLGDNLPTIQEPIGLPIAHIKSVPAISFDAHYFWRNRIIKIQKTGSPIEENTTFEVYNLCLETDYSSKEFTKWIDNFFSLQLNNVETIVKFLDFTKYKVELDKDFLTQFLEWKNNNQKTYKHLLSLMKDVELHPFTGGIGQTENLKNRGKEASKRISQTDRLSYALENNILTFIACKGHYEFH